MMKIEYGVPSDKEGIQLRLGIERGFFADEGIDLSLRVVFGGPEIAAEYDSGRLKLGELGSPPATTALAKGARFRIVGSGIRRRTLQYLVAAPSIADWPDLRGQALGVLSIGSCSYWFARMVLERNGLDPDRDVRVVGLGARYPQVIDLFKSGELRAGVLSEPNIAIGEYHGAFRVLKALTEPTYCPTMQWTVTVANNDVIAREPELVRAVLRGCRRAYHHAADHPDELAHFGARYFGIDAPTMLRAIERERADLHYDCEVDMAGLEQAIALQQRLGAFTTPLQARDLVDDRYLPRAGAESTATA
jgi:ABC-type nitrate/sulfonate/bicarbonate transport system substrate-binding protein